MGHKESKQRVSEALEHFQTRTRLNAVAPPHIIQVFFAQVQDPNQKKTNCLSKKQFNDALTDLEKFGAKKLANTPLSDRLFEAFDADKSGFIELNVNQFILAFFIFKGMGGRSYSYCQWNRCREGRE